MLFQLSWTVGPRQREVIGMWLGNGMRNLLSRLGWVSCVAGDAELVDISECDHPEGKTETPRRLFWPSYTVIHSVLIIARLILKALSPKADLKRYTYPGKIGQHVAIWVLVPSCWMCLFWIIQPWPTLRGKFAPSRSGKQGKCYHSTGTPSNACGCSMIFHNFPLLLTVNHPEMVKYHSTIYSSQFIHQKNTRPTWSFYYQPLNIQTSSNPSSSVFSHPG